MEYVGVLTGWGPELDNICILCSADINIDCIIDRLDLAILAGQWLSQGSDLDAGNELSADLNCDK